MKITSLFPTNLEHVNKKKQKENFIRKNVRTLLLGVITLVTLAWAYGLQRSMTDPDLWKMPKFYVAMMLNIALGLFVWFLTEGIRIEIRKKNPPDVTQFAANVGNIVTRLKDLETAVGDLSTRLYGPVIPGRAEREGDGDVNALRQGLSALDQKIDWRYTELEWRLDKFLNNPKQFCLLNDSVALSNGSTVTTLQDSLDKVKGWSNSVSDEVKQVAESIGKSTGDINGAVGSQTSKLKTELETKLEKLQGDVDHIREALEQLREFEETDTLESEEEEMNESDDDD